MTANSTRPPITILLTHFRAKIISPSPEGRSASPFDSGLTGEDVEIKYTSAACNDFKWRRGLDNTVLSIRLVHIIVA